MPRPKMIAENKPIYKNPRSTQKTIPVSAIYPGGVFAHGNIWSITGRVPDTNYISMSEAERKNMLAGYEEVFKSVDINKHFKMSLINRVINEADILKTITLDEQEDAYDKFRREISAVNKERAIIGTNNIRRERYFTVDATGRSYEDVRPWFNRIESTLQANFGAIDSDFMRLDTKERIRLFHDFFRPEDIEHFLYDEMLARKRGHSLKNFFAPGGMEFTRDHFRVGKLYGRALQLVDYPSYLRDTMINELMSLPRQMILSIDMVSEDKTASVATLGRMLADVSQEIGNQSSRAIQQNNIHHQPSTRLTDQQKGIVEAQRFIDEYDQRILWTQVTIVHVAPSLEELDADTDYIFSIAQRCSARFDICYHLQEQGLNTALPYSLVFLPEENYRTLSSENCSILMPFQTKEIWDKQGIVYGTNQISKNLIVSNKLELQNGNTWILGVPGSGKSFLAKYEMLYVFLMTSHRIIIHDPDSEYGQLVKNLSGVTFQLAPGSPHHFNIMAMAQDEDYDAAVAQKCEVILTMCKMAFEEQMGPAEESIIDRCARALLTRSAKRRQTVTLLDLYKMIKEQPEPEAQNIAVCLELYVLGSFDFASKETNIDVENNRICSFDVHSLGERSKRIAYLLMTDFTKNVVSQNRKKGQRTHVYSDEIQKMFKDVHSAEFFDDFWRYVRKAGAFGVAISQNAKSLLESGRARDMISNSEMVFLMNQAPEDLAALVPLLEISDQQRKFLKNAPSGCGLLRRSGVIVPFDARFSTETETYRMLTTKIDEVTRGD